MPARQGIEHEVGDTARSGIAAYGQRAGQGGVVGINPSRCGDRTALTHGDACGTRQVDEGGGAFASGTAEGLEPEVRDSIAVPTRLRSAWMPRALRLYTDKGVPIHGKGRSASRHGWYRTGTVRRRRVRISGNSP